MLQVRKVRVGDVKLANLYRSRPLGDAKDDEQHYDAASQLVSADGQTYVAAHEEGVLLKAAAENAKFRITDKSKDIDWASLHMNLALQNAVAPGAELVMAVSDEPTPAEGNTFVGMLGDVPVDGFVGVPPEGDDGSEFSFTLKPSNQMGGDEFRVTFQGYQAHRFIRALLYWWLPGLQE